MLEQAPDYRPARYDYAQVLLQRHKHRQAREQIRMLREEEPDERAYRITQATLATELGECEQALREYGGCSRRRRITRSCTCRWRTH